MTAEEKLRELKCDKCDNDAVRLSIDSHLCFECFLDSKMHREIKGGKSGE